MRLTLFLSLCRRARLTARAAGTPPLLATLAAVAVLVTCSNPAVAQTTPAGGGMLAIPPKSTAAATPAPTPVNVSFKPPKVLTRVSPAYPELALLNRAEGILRVRFGIDEQGHVSTIGIMESSGSVWLDTAVRDPNLSKWTFQPATLDGKPIAASLEEEVEFRLDPAQQRQFALERLALKPNDLPDPPYPSGAIPYKLKGTCDISAIFTERGLVDIIYLDKPSGFKYLDDAALRWAFTHWCVDPGKVKDKSIYPKDKEGKVKPYSKAVTFTPPAS